MVAVIPAYEPDAVFDRSGIAFFDFPDLTSSEGSVDHAMDHSSGFSDST